MERSFRLAALPQLYVGEGMLSALPDWLDACGYSSILLCIGGSSLQRAGHLDTILSLCSGHKVSVAVERISGEPSPETVDTLTASYVNSSVECVVGIGGGSVIDAAKAVSAMMAESRSSGCVESVLEFLEGVGTREPSGRRVGLVAVPTTSGTGTEATKNAVISSVGSDGFKKSLRHIRYVPDLAILDGTLMTSCPASVTAASGLDAVTQLLESYVSTAANPFTDVLALDGLKMAGRVLPGLVDGRLSMDIDARTTMAYAAYLSGVTLANANLGVVHGAASVLGGFLPIPHGVVCGTLLHAATRTIIRKLTLTKEESGSAAALRKFSEAGFALSGRWKEVMDTSSSEEGLELLLSTLDRWQTMFPIALLSEYGFTSQNLKELSPKVGLKNTPVGLSGEEIESILLQRL